MNYFNMTGTATAMPKFVLYSGHAETVAPILHAFKSPLLLNPDAGSMVLVNFYVDQHADETEAEEISNNHIHVVIKYVPHLRLSDEVVTIAAMSINEFQRWVANSLSNYIDESGVETRSVPEMCKDTYVRSAEDGYGDPWKFRKNMYEAFDFHPPKPLQIE